jgi:hypothetical protein
MTNASIWIVLLGVVGCTSSSPQIDPVVGTGSFAINGAAQSVAAVWAQAGYLFIDDQNDSVGVYEVSFDAMGAGVPCSETSSLSTVLQIGLVTTQVFTPRTAGTPTLSTGPIPVVASASISDTMAPPAPVAEIRFVSPEMRAGTVTITAFGATAIEGTFEASGSDTRGSTMVTGAFAATICPAD